MQDGFRDYSDEQLYAVLSSKKRVAERAFGELYARHSQKIYAYCLKVLRNPDEAGDIFQETFMRLHKCAAKKQEIRNVPGFLLTIARNLCLNHKRDSKHTVEVEDYHQVVDPNVRRDSREYLQLIDDALQQLDHDLKEAFVLKEYQGMRYKEIAEITGASVPALKNRVWRAREAIKKILTPYRDELAQMKD